MSMLTTRDNPFDPRISYDAWLEYDEEAGYFTNEYLARIASTSPTMTEEETHDAIETAIDEIIRVDPFGIYMKLPDKPTKDSENIEKIE